MFNTSLNLSHNDNTPGISHNDIYDWTSISIGIFVAIILTYIKAFIFENVVIKTSLNFAYVEEYIPQW